MLVMILIIHIMLMWLGCALKSKDTFRPLNLIFNQPRNNGSLMEH